jgi:hypothetical protein|mmetsp:Transcript_23294/g.42235  ORF Transcript_23294/g.42235 Transcript_23294/m.42235 type:complete len:87 (+) Transcript_23294:979-1239(+)
MDALKDALVYVDEEPQLKRLAKMVVAHCAPATRLKELRQAFFMPWTALVTGLFDIVNFAKQLSPMALQRRNLRRFWLSLIRIIQGW